MIHTHMIHTFRSSVTSWWEIMMSGSPVIGSLWRCANTRQYQNSSAPLHATKPIRNRSQQQLMQQCCTNEQHETRVVLQQCCISNTKEPSAANDAAGPHTVNFYMFSYLQKRVTQTRAEHTWTSMQRKLECARACVGVYGMCRWIVECLTWCRLVSE